MTSSEKANFGEKLLKIGTISQIWYVYVLNGCLIVVKVEMVFIKSKKVKNATEIRYFGVGNHIGWNFFPIFDIK